MGVGTELVGAVNLIHLDLRQVSAQLGKQHLHTGSPLPPDTIKDGSGLAHRVTRGLERVLRVHDHHRLLLHRFFH